MCFQLITLLILIDFNWITELVDKIMSYHFNFKLLLIFYTISNISLTYLAFLLLINILYSSTHI
jgi:hypothetical protein